MKIGDGTVIALTICFLIVLAGSASILSKLITTRMEIEASRKIEEGKRETLRLETDEFIKRLKLASWNED